MPTIAVILAAGVGERFGSDKVALPLRGVPVWRWSFDAFLRHPGIDGVGLVVPPARVEAMERAAPEASFVAAGGASRQESAANGLRACPSGTQIVLLHDAARPFVTSEVIDRVLDGVARSGAAAPGIPIADTVRQRTGGSSRGLDRSSLVAMQTPQGARFALLASALALADADHTDEMSLVEAAGGHPEIVAGDENNFKLTRPGDLERARAHLGAGETRVGIGYDVHAFAGARPGALVLGGERFEGTPRLAGHSDADPLLHAVCDALLGAAGLGDIGQRFPDTDPQWQDAPSIEFVADIGAALGRAGWRIVNIDSTVIAEFPRVMERADRIREHIARALGIEPGQISVKATTNERLGAIGRGEGIAAFATATVQMTP